MARDDTNNLFLIFDDDILLSQGECARSLSLSVLRLLQYYTVTYSCFQGFSLQQMLDSNLGAALPWYSLLCHDITAPQCTTPFFKTTTLGGRVDEKCIALSGYLWKPSNFPIGKTQWILHACNNLFFLLLKIVHKPFPPSVIHPPSQDLRNIC